MSALALSCGAPPAAAAKPASVGAVHARGASGVDGAEVATPFQDSMASDGVPFALARLEYLPQSSRRSRGRTPPDSGGAPRLVRTATGAGDRLDLNLATAEQLTALPGIGPRRAARIIERRTQQPFRGVDELGALPGFGLKVAQRLQLYLRIGPHP